MKKFVSIVLILCVTVDRQQRCVIAMISVLDSVSLKDETNVERGKVSVESENNYWTRLGKIS